jgi:hypothetical protein
MVSMQVAIYVFTIHCPSQDNGSTACEKDALRSPAAAYTAFNCGDHGSTTHGKTSGPWPNLSFNFNATCIV